MTRTLAFEWTKFWSIRAHVWTLVAVAALAPGFAGFVAATDSLQPDDTILGASLTAAVLVQLAAAVLGSLVVTGEYASGTIQPSLTAQPRRLHLLAAKATLVGGALFVVALASCGAALAVGLATLDRDVHATGDPWPAVLGVALVVALSGVLGVATGAVVRRSAGAVAAVVGFVLLPSLVAPLFGDLQRWIAGAAPAAALQKLTQTSDATPETVGSLGPWASLALVAGYTLAALSVGGRLLCARDA